MAKINITKPTNETEVLALLSAFKVDNNTYIVFDSEKIGSVGLPIIYISKYTEKLEKIVDPNEWQSVKNYLKGIINGANFEFVKVMEHLNSDETFYTPLTLPAASFDTIKNRYVVEEPAPEGVLEPVNEVIASPIMPDNNVSSNSNIFEAPINNPIPVSEFPNINPVSDIPVKEDSVASVIPEIPTVAPVTPVAPIHEKNETTNTQVNINFEMDKETFLKACENMFDALVSKYQKELTSLLVKEQELAKKEQEINIKMANASEVLANAQAKEQVANIAHDHAKEIMDLSSIMPHPSDAQEAGVI